MDLIMEDMRRVLSIKTKARHDSIFDQYSRVFMPKILFFFSLLVGVNWYFEKFTCIIPQKLFLSRQFITDVCWINGFYIYQNMTSRMTPYYGIPELIKENGMTSGGNLCETGKTKNCIQMMKFYYIQYQWFPFFMASLIFLYFIPHIAFKIVNADLITLKNAIKIQSYEEISNTYFNIKLNTPLRMSFKVFGNVFVKIAYILANVGTFLLIDHTLDRKYLKYASYWLSWTLKGNSEMFDYSKFRKSFRAGEMLLPSFGLCDVQTLSSDMKESSSNKYRIVCEFSAHILYHYALILLWFFIVIGIVSSVLGLTNQLGKYLLILYLYPNKNKNTGDVLKALSLREEEYLDYIRSKNIALYGLLLNKLRQERLGESSDAPFIEILKKQVLEIRNQVESIVQKRTNEINEC